MATTTVGNAPANEQGNRGLRIGLWVAQGLLAFAFFGSGLMKLLTPYEQLAASMPWAAVTPAWLVPIIGASEVLGAIGLILPSAARIQPRLTGYAAIGLVIVMVLAIGVHFSIGEYLVIPNLVLGGLAAFVAWGRLVKAPIPPR